MPIHFLPPTRTPSNTSTPILLSPTTTTPPTPSNRFSPTTRRLILILGSTIGALITLLCILALIRFFHLERKKKQKETAWRKAEEMSRSSSTDSGDGDPDWLLKRSVDGGREVLFDHDTHEFGDDGEGVGLGLGLGGGRRDSSGVKEPEESYYFCPSKTPSWGSDDSGTGLV